MYAISQEVLGGPEVLHEIELPVPQPGPSEILIRVRATALNPTDWKHRAFSGMFLPAPPFVLGWDVAGEVVAVGYGVTLFAPGDEVFGMLPYPHGHGSAAEYVVGPARAFVRKPSNLNHAEAAAIPLAALTAYQALIDIADIQAGQRVLVHAAAGGVGHFAVQIAKSRGAHVIGTASAPNHPFLRELGIDEVIDYRTTDFTTAVRDVDVVVDPLGSDNVMKSLRVVRPGGIVVSLLGGDAAQMASEAEKYSARVALMLVEADQAGMRAIADMATAGTLRPTVADTFPLAEAAKAHALGDTERTVGKIVLTVP